MSLLEWFALVWFVPAWLSLPWLLYEYEHAAMDSDCTNEVNHAR